ncbi:extensin-1-like [Penaeus japonicus]|uniref:extensin-1-like n=1 Tax=Penaeus japonicus TaxID=27405 RepID=UPI001C713EA8|nr:extensin-1-like [Penaeus japonicus]
MRTAVLILLAMLAVSAVTAEPGKLKYRPRPRYHPVHLVHRPVYHPVHVVHKPVPVVVHKPVPVVVHKPAPVYHHAPSYGGYHG